MTTWTLSKPKWFLRESAEVAGQEADQLHHLSVSEYRGIVPRHLGDDGQAVSVDVGHYKRCRPGDIVLNKLWAFRGGIGTSPSEGLVSPAYAVFRPSADVDPWFLHYLFRSQPFVARMAARVKGLGGEGSVPGRSPHLNVSDFMDIPVRMPLLEVQSRIADYLDTETAQIDRLVRQNERAAALAEEAWQTVLSEVLFRGVETPFGALPSGHPPGYLPLWLAARTFSGKTLQSAPMSTTDVAVPYLTAANITEEGVDLTGVREMWASEHERALLGVREGDVLVIEGGATAGRPALLKVEPSVTTILQNHVHCVRPQRGFYGDFLFWVLSAYYHSGWYGAYVSGVTFGSFPTSKLRGLLVPKLSYKQQRELSRELHERRDDVVRTQVGLREFSQLLHERRQALITAAVTGELEV